MAYSQRLLSLDARHRQQPVRVGPTRENMVCTGRGFQALNIMLKSKSPLARSLWKGRSLPIEQSLQFKLLRCRNPNQITFPSGSYAVGQKRDRKQSTYCEPYSSVVTPYKR